MYLERKLVTNAFIVIIMMIIWHLRLRKLLAGLFEILMIKAAIPRFIIPMRMSIRIRVRKILMRTPYSAFQYPSNVSAYFYLTFNCACIILFSFTGKCNIFYLKCGYNQRFFYHIYVSCCKYTMYKRPIMDLIY